jgi:hypothetical protein
MYPTYLNIKGEVKSDRRERTNRRQIE